MTKLNTEQHCILCNKPYTVRMTQQRFCSVECRRAFQQEDRKMPSDRELAAAERQAAFERAERAEAERRIKEAAYEAEQEARREAQADQFVRTVWGGQQPSKRVYGELPAGAVKGSLCGRRACHEKCLLGGCHA